jgi:hypothetical protein
MFHSKIEETVNIRCEALTVVLLKIQFFGVWLCVIGWVLSDILRDHSAVLSDILRDCNASGQAVKEDWLLGLFNHEDKGIEVFINIGNNLPNDSAIYRKTWICRNSKCIV